VVPAVAAVVAEAAVFLLRCAGFFLCLWFSLSTRFLPSLQWMCGLPPVRSGSQWRGRGTAAAAVVFSSSQCVLSLSTMSSSLCRGCAADSSRCWWQSGNWGSCLDGGSPSLLSVVLYFCSVSLLPLWFCWHWQH